MNNQKNPNNSRISKLLAVIVLVMTVLGTAQAATQTVSNASDSGVTATLDALTIANGRVRDSFARGGGIFNNGTLNQTNSTLSGNTARSVK